MGPLLIALGAAALFLLAYRIYGRWLARCVFQLDDRNVTPACELQDGQDFVPSSKRLVFGHHFTSIAGTGPIVGPALAVIWGWVPALLWVVFGSIFIGAVHDFGALVLSLRSKGKTVGEIAGEVISPRARTLFLVVLILALTIVLAIFGLVIASVFRLFPQAIFPCLVQIPLAIAIGVALRRGKAGLLWPSLAALGLMLGSIALDPPWLQAFNATLAQWSILTWCAVLLAYCFVASVLPVWLLLQPRDYINSLQLGLTLGLLLLGLVVAALLPGEGKTLSMVAPAVRWAPEGAPAIFPFLFITIACGAISGFHCLVSSGTSSKQLKKESDAPLIGFGSMLTEGFLAVIVILACTAGLGLGIVEAGGIEINGPAAYQARYETWASAGGLGAKVGAFVEGSANFLRALGLPAAFAISLMGVFVASFAATTLDTACRLQRYLIQELVRGSKAEPSPIRCALSQKYVATFLAVGSAFLIARLPGSTGTAPGTGGTLLWPLFGAINQLLAGLSFLVILLWLRRRQLPRWFALPPALLMLVLPAVAMAMNLQDYWEGGKTLLIFLGLVVLTLEVFLVREAARAWRRV